MVMILLRKRYKHPRNDPITALPDQA